MFGESRCPRNCFAGRLTAAIALTLLAGILAPADASAQITVKDLLGKFITDVPPAMGKDVQDAITAFTNAKFGDARELLKAANEKYPQLPPAGVLMAQMLVAANQGAAARAELENMVVEVPNDPEPYLVFGDLAFQQQRFTESHLCFAKAGALVPGYSAQHEAAAEPANAGARRTGRRGRRAEAVRRRSEAAAASGSPSTRTAPRPTPVWGGRSSIRRTKSRPTRLSASCTMRSTPRKTPTRRSPARKSTWRCSTPKTKRNCPTQRS